MHVITVLVLALIATKITSPVQGFSPGQAPAKRRLSQASGSVKRMTCYVPGGKVIDAPVFDDENPAPNAPLGATDFGGKIATAISNLLSRRLLQDSVPSCCPTSSYIVQPGDTIDSLALKNDVSAGEITAFSKLPMGASIKEGQEIQIPCDSILAYAIEKANATSSSPSPSSPSPTATQSPEIISVPVAVGGT